MRLKLTVETLLSLLSLYKKEEMSTNATTTNTC